MSPTRGSSRLAFGTMCLLVVGACAAVSVLRSPVPTFMCGQSALRDLLMQVGCDEHSVNLAVDSLGSDWVTTADQLVGAAKLAGVTLRIDSTLLAGGQPTPFIAWQQRGHFVVVVESRTTSFLVLDNRFGGRTVTISRSNFEREFGGILLVPVSISEAKPSSEN